MPLLKQYVAIYPLLTPQTDWILNLNVSKMDYSKWVKAKLWVCTSLRMQQLISNLFCKDLLVSYEMQKKA